MFELRITVSLMFLLKSFFDFIHVYFLAQYRCVLTIISLLLEFFTFVYYGIVSVNIFIVRGFYICLLSYRLKLHDFIIFGFFNPLICLNLF